MPEKIIIPEDTSLQLNRSQWLALKGLLEFWNCRSGNYPFVDHYCNEILDLMGSYAGLAYSGIDETEEYRNFCNGVK